MGAHTQIPIELIKEMDDYLCYYDLKSYDFDPLLRRYPDDDYLVGMQFAQLVEEGMEDKVIGLLTPKLVELGTFQFYALGLAWELKKNDDKALYYHLKSIEKDIDECNIWSRMRAGLINFDLNNDDIALHYMDAALHVNPIHPKALFDKADILLKLEKELEFIDLIKQIPSTYKPAAVYQLKGDYYLNKDNYDRAYTFYEKSLFFDYNQDLSHLGIIAIFLEQEKFDLVQKYLAQCLKDFPQNDRFMYEYATFLRYHTEYKIMNDNVVEQLLRRAILIHPDEQYLTELVYFYLDGFNNSYRSLLDLLRQHNKGKRSPVLDAHIILVLYYFSEHSEAKRLLERYTKIYSKEEQDYLHDLLQEYELF